MNKPTKFWLWWFTDEAGRRRRTSYRMTGEVARGRYSDAEPVAGTLEIRNLQVATGKQHQSGNAAASRRPADSEKR